MQVARGCDMLLSTRLRQPAARIILPFAVVLSSVQYCPCICTLRAMQSRALWVHIQDAKGLYGAGLA